MSLKNYFVKVNSKNLQWTGHYEIFGKWLSAGKLGQVFRMEQVLLSRHTIQYSIYFPAVNDFSASVFALEFTFPLQIRSVNLYS
jgi:hypothetical protein